MPRTNFENLRVDGLAEQLADEVWNAVRQWDGFARDTVGKQLVRAADRIGANVAEGNGRASNQDDRRFLRIARGSLCEPQHRLRCAFRRGLLTPKQVARLKSVVDPLAPALNVYLRSIGCNCAQAQSPKTQDQNPSR